MQRHLESREEEKSSAEDAEDHDSMVTEDNVTWAAWRDPALSTLAEPETDREDEGVISNGGVVSYGGVIPISKLTPSSFMNVHEHTK
eukprot:23226-Rhodomonas_salina.1